MTGRLEDKRILVTGAGSGIGRAIVSASIAEGAIVFGADVNIEAAEVSCAAGATALGLDVASEDSWKRLRESVPALDGLVNCAGIDALGDDLERCSDETWERMMRVNLDGVFLGTRFAVEAMSEAGSGGSIVNLASVLALTGSGDTISYGASKAAVGGLTRSVAAAVAGDGIRCNSVHPGYIRTPMTKRWTDSDGASDEDETVSLHPLGRLGEPEEIANLVVYLLSDESAYVSGSQLAVDGGYLAV